MDTPNAFPPLTRYLSSSRPLTCSGDIHCPLWANLGLHPPYRPPCSPRGHFVTWIAETQVPHVRTASLQSGQHVWCGEAVHPFLAHVAPLYSQAGDLTPFWAAYYALLSTQGGHDDT